MTRTGGVRVAVGCCWLLLMLGMAASHGDHGSPGQQPPTDFNDPSITKNEAHMKEHMKHEMNTDRQMSPEEMEFHYFRLHDTNNDTHLDGLEILAALNHMMPPLDFMPHETQGKSPEQLQQMRQQRHNEMFNNYVNIIDKVLINDDRNNDGYLSYTEYIVARRRDAKKMHEAQQRMMHEAAMMQQQQMQQFQEFQKFQQQQQQQQQQLQGNTQQMHQGGYQGQQIQGQQVQGQQFQGQGQPGQPMQGQQFQQAPPKL